MHPAPEPLDTSRTRWGHPLNPEPGTVPDIWRFGVRLYNVYRQVFQIPYILHFEPSLDALSLRSDVISSTKILFQREMHVTRLV